MESNNTYIPGERRELTRISVVSAIYAAIRRFTATSPIGALALAFLILVVLVAALADFVARPNAQAQRTGSRWFSWLRWPTL